MTKIAIVIAMLFAGTVSAFADPQTEALVTNNLERLTKAQIEQRAITEAQTKKINELEQKAVGVQSKTGKEEVRIIPLDKQEPANDEPPKAQTLSDADIKREWSNRNPVDRVKLVQQQCGSKAKWWQDPLLTPYVHFVLQSYTPDQGLKLVKTCDLTDMLSIAEGCMTSAKTVLSGGQKSPDVNREKAQGKDDLFSAEELQTLDRLIMKAGL